METKTAPLSTLRLLAGGASGFKKVGLRLWQTMVGKGYEMNPDDYLKQLEQCTNDTQRCDVIRAVENDGWRQGMTEAAGKVTALAETFENLLNNQETAEVLYDLRGEILVARDRGPGKEK